MGRNNPPKVTEQRAPRKVKQFREEACWAAALESWLYAAAEPRRRRTQNELLKEKVEIETSKGQQPETGIRVPEFQSLVIKYGMATNVLTGVNAFNPDHIAQALKVSVLLIGYELEKYSQWWHDVVLYRVTIPSKDEPKYAIMDPANGDYRTVSKAAFFQAGIDEPWLIGWKASRSSVTIY